MQINRLFESKLLAVLLLVIVAHFPDAQANVSDIQLKNFSVEQGLSQSTVIDIIEDADGYMWFATMDGLNKFDGKNFVSYFPSVDSSTSLPSEYARKLFIDSNDTLWIATLGGISRYVSERDQFVSYTSKNSRLESNETFAIAETPDGSLIVSGANKLYKYDPNLNDFFPMSFTGDTFNDAVRTLFVEEQRIWIGTEYSGIFMLDIASNELFKLDKPNPWNIVLNVGNLYDVKLIDQNYWLGTDAGVLILSSDGEIVKRLDASQDSKPRIINNIARTIQAVDDNKVWIGTRDGFSVYDLESDTVFSISQDNYMHIGLSSRFIVKIFKDSNDSLWLGTYTGGLFQYHEQFASVKHFRNIYSNSFSDTDNSVWALTEIENGMLWIATSSGGLSLFNSNTGEFQAFLKDSTFDIWDATVDNSKRLWLATSKGLLVYEYANNQLKEITNLVPGVIIVDLYFLGTSVWAKDWNEKLYAFNSETLETEFSNIVYKDMSNVTPLFKDSYGSLWFRTATGLSVENSKKDFINLQLSSDSLDDQPVAFNVHETDEAFWVSTAKHGLYKIHKTSYRIVENINPLGQDVRGMVFNSLLYGKNKDSVWQSSTSQIWQISLETGEVLQSISRAKLDYNDLNQGSALVVSNGLVLFGGTMGFHVFDPKKLNIVSSSNGIPEETGNLSHQPIITQLRILNRIVNPESVNSPLTVPISKTTSIELSSNASPFSLEFGLINALFEHNYRYRYRLVGLSDEWIETSSNDTIATFTNLRFGDYVFVVQSKNVGDQWSKPALMQIKVLPPIWLHSSALAIYGLIVLLLLSYVYRQYKRKLSIQNAIQESEERLKLTLWSSGDELWDWDVFSGQVYRANTWGTLDFPQDSIRANSSYQANIHQNDIDRVKEALSKHINGESDYFQVTYRARTHKGEWIWVLDRGMVVKRDNTNQPMRMTGTLKNINHLKLAEEQLKLYKRSIETISDGVFIADTAFHFISVNQAYCDCTGETREQGLASFLKFNQYPEAFTEEVKKSSRQKGNWNGEVESVRINGERYEMELNIDAVQGEDGKISHYVGVFSDITSRKSTEKELLKLANTDPLTEMPNRSFFQASHNNMVRKDLPHALVCLDMDNFKKINDSLGHQTGDILIRQIGKRLQKLAGNSATCYRLGGDEFSILIDNPEEMSRINHYAQKVLDQMANPFIINKQEFVLGASVGIAFYPEDGNTPQELLKNADTAMYFAKNAGGNKYQFFSGEMNQNAVRQLQIENLIRYGLKDDLFTVFYQPKVDISTGKLVSMEALVRFEHPEKGIVSPSQFIPLAEETGQIVEIGELVLRKACEDTKRWVSQGLFSGRVAVNFSAKQFELPDLDDRIIRILQKAGLSPLHLECEITEGTLMGNPEQSLKMMQRLREKGIHLALDDFGTGYSSLAYLKQFPLNTLKIDKAFIDDIATSSVDKHMAAAIINIAHNLGLKVVAEGVEQEQQLAILKRYECEMLQGYLYSKPLSSARFEKLLNENLHIDQLINQNSSRSKSANS